MKTILALATALIMGTAFAQEGTSPLDSSTGSKHMFEFNADSLLRGVFSLDKSKTPGSDADNDIELDLRLNYAYQLDTMPKIQLGWRADYLKDTGAAGDTENYAFQVGGIYNLSTDLMNTTYASLYVGMLWNNEYGNVDQGNTNDEVLISTIALGKRYSMESIGLKHLTYTPEVALQNRNSTTGGDLEYAQSLEFRFLQFSVFF